MESDSDGNSDEAIMQDVLKTTKKSKTIKVTKEHEARWKHFLEYGKARGWDDPCAKELDDKWPARICIFLESIAKMSEEELKTRQLKRDKKGKSNKKVTMIYLYK